MKLYKDKELTEEIKIDDLIDFGIVPAGESKQYTIWILNDSRAYLRKLEFIIEHSEIEIIEAPTELSAQTIGELIIEWNPSITLKEGLKVSLRIKREELWG